MAYGIKRRLFQAEFLIALLSIWQVQKELEDMKKKYEELKAQVSMHSSTNGFCMWFYVISFSGSKS